MEKGEKLFSDSEDSKMCKTSSLKINFEMIHSLAYMSKIKIKQKIINEQISWIRRGSSRIKVVDTIF